MKMPSEAETMKIFETLGLRNEEDRLRILLQSGKNFAITSELPDIDYYTIRLSNNSNIVFVEDNYNAKLEGSSRRD